jgi:hypothetical protein
MILMILGWTKIMKSSNHGPSFHPINQSSRHQRARHSWSEFWRRWKSRSEIAAPLREGTADSGSIARWEIQPLCPYNPWTGGDANLFNLWNAVFACVEIPRQLSAFTCVHPRFNSRPIGRANHFRGPLRDSLQPGPKMIHPFKRQGWNRIDCVNLGQVPRCSLDPLGTRLGTTKALVFSVVLRVLRGASFRSAKCGRTIFGVN